MSAGAYIVALMKRSREELQRSDPALDAAEHGIPIAWATEYLRRERQNR